MVEREAFEKCNPVPDDAEWSERKQGYYWRQHPGVNHPFDDNWMTWQDACDWQASRAKDGFIRCTERLPNRGDTVLGYRDYGDGTFDYWLCAISESTSQFVRQPDALPVHPTHWVRLPGPPSE